MLNPKKALESSKLRLATLFIFGVGVSGLAARADAAAALAVVRTRDVNLFYRIYDAAKARRRARNFNATTSTPEVMACANLFPIASSPVMLWLRQSPKTETFMTTLEPV